MNQAFGRHFLEDSLVGTVIVLTGILTHTRRASTDSAGLGARGTHQLHQNRRQPAQI